MRTFISFEEARRLVLDAARVVSEVSCALEEAHGRTVARDVRTVDPVPPFASSGMDGFAVRSQDLSEAGGSLRVIGHVAAGGMPTQVLGPGDAVRIMTGAPIPEGADAVVPVEWTAGFASLDAWTGATVEIDRGISPGRHIRPAGEDLQAGAVVVAEGTVVSPPVVGLLASVGATDVPVRRRPHVMLLTTGDEVVDAGSTPAPGQIRDSNGPGLAAQISLAGGRVDRKHVPDDPDVLRTCIEEARGSDLLILTGGVSVGAHDHVQDQLVAAGGSILFWKVRQRPGKPLLFGMLGSTLVLGLPGNPVSSAMCFEMYGRPVLAAMLGQSVPTPGRLRAFLAEHVTKVPDLHYFMRGRVSQADDGRLMVRPTGPQGSNLYSSVSDADCIVHLPAGPAELDAGTPVGIDVLPWARNGLF